MAITIMAPTAAQVHAKEDETGLRSEIIRTIKSHAANAPRSLQRAIGPSQVGTECPRQLAFLMSDPNRFPPSRSVMHDPWPSIVGTAVHAWLAECFETADPTKWLVEQRVEVGLGLGGSCDVFHVPSGTVLDHKVLGDTQHRKYTTEGPSRKYRVQAHCYGMGYLRLGYEVNRVGIAFFGRAKSLSALHIWSEPFDQDIAVETLARMKKVQELVDAGVDPMRIPERAGDDCWFCDYRSANKGRDGYCCGKSES